MPIGEWVSARRADGAPWPEALKVAVNISPAQFSSRRPGAGRDRARSRASGLPQAGSSSRSPSRSCCWTTTRRCRRCTSCASSASHRHGRLRHRLLLAEPPARFPFDKIKIDQSFVRGLGDEADCIAIIRLVIGHVDSLGIATTAEGVETVWQLACCMLNGAQKFRDSSSRNRFRRTTSPR